MERSMTMNATTTEARERALTVDTEEESARAPDTGLGHHRAGGPSGCLRYLLWSDGSTTNAQGLSTAAWHGPVSRH